MARTRRRKRHTQQADAEAAPAQGGGVPRSFVLKRGRLAALVDELADDVRKVRRGRRARFSACPERKTPAARFAGDGASHGEEPERAQAEQAEGLHPRRRPAGCARCASPSGGVA